jgi:predicted transcriptional regulator of viral defense system
MRKLTKYMLSKLGGKAATKDEIAKICKSFGAKVDSTINFMISYGYLVRILRGLYYVKTIEEFGLKKSKDILEIVSLGMNKLGVKWYFGLHTGLRLNGLTHEFSDTVFVMNDKVYRPKEILIGGQKVKFIKLVSKLFDFGVVTKNAMKFSNVEKTLLDLVYISRYRSVPETKALSTIEDYRANAETKKIKAYLKFYPKAMERMIANAGLV